MTLVSLLLPALEAATLIVDPGDPTAYPDLSSACAEAEPGDRIELQPGEHQACLSLSGAQLSIAGVAGSAATSWSPAGDCEELLSLSDGSQLSLEGVSMSLPGGRAVSLVDSSLTLSDVEIAESGSDGYYGGALYAYNAQLQTESSRFLRNQGEFGGALFLDGFVSWEDEGSSFEENAASSMGGAVFAWYEDSILLTESQFLSNQSGSGGGGLAVQDAVSLALYGVRLTENQAGWGGGGLYLYNTGAEVPLVDTVFSGNRSAGSGGGLESVTSNHLLLERAVFEDNEASGYGGALTNWYYGETTVTESRFSGNRSAAWGGGLFHYPEDSSSWPLTVSSSHFEGNQAAGTGGGLWAGWTQLAEIRDSAFYFNQSDSTGGGIGIYVVEEALLLRNLACGNQAYAGGGVSVEWATRDRWENNSLWENQAEYGGGGWRYAAYDGVLHQNDWVGNAASAWGGGYMASYGYADFRNNLVAYTLSGNGVYAGDMGSSTSSSLAWSAWSQNEVIDAGGYFWVEDGLDGHRVVEDPGLVSWSADGLCEDDLRLRGDSELVDQGDPELLDLDGSRSDPGAGGGAEAPLRDLDGDGWDTAEDCDDTDPDIHPEAVELCDLRDRDCDGLIDGPDPQDGTWWYEDRDGDGWGAEEAAVLSCARPGRYVSVPGDCDDEDAWAHPGAPERAMDGVDQDCDGEDLTREDSLGDSGGWDSDHEEGAEDQAELEASGGCSCQQASAAGRKPWSLLTLVLLCLHGLRARSEGRADRLRA